MALNIDLTTLPGYEQRKANYDGAITAARAANDEAAIARAELQWERDQRELTTQAFEQRDRERSVEAARLQVQAQYGGNATVMAAIASLSDPEAITKTAEAVAASLNGTPPAAPPQTGQPPQQPPAQVPGGQWPAAPMVTPPPPPPPANPLADPAAHEALFDDIMNRPPHAPDEPPAPWQREQQGKLDSLELYHLEQLGVGQPRSRIQRDPAAVKPEKLFRGRP